VTFHCCLLQVRAASDLKALAKLIPADSRLVLDPEAPLSAAAAAKAAAAGGSSSSSSVREGVDLVMVPTSSVRPGDLLRVLPGEEG
jgi:Cu2+-exporting ATPase